MPNKSGGRCEGVLRPPLLFGIQGCAEQLWFSACRIIFLRCSCWGSSAVHDEGRAASLSSAASVGPAAVQEERPLECGLAAAGGQVSEQPFSRTTILPGHLQLGTQTQLDIGVPSERSV